MNVIFNLFDRVFRRLTDKLAALLGRGDELTPPPRMFSDPDRLDGSRNIREFVMIGESMASWLIGQGLAPSHRVLDIGCGVGRLARPLTKYLTGTGSYDGIDVSLEKIRYCQQTFGRRHSNFHFHHADIYNSFYNPSGLRQASEYRFPFEDEKFDFVVLVSVFTHMLPEDVEHYLSEIARVMKQNAHCVCTFWLINEPAENRHFEYSDVCRIYSKEHPEHGVFYVEDYVRSLFTRSNLDLLHVYHGDHKKKKQDIVIAVR